MKPVECCCGGNKGTYIQYSPRTNTYFVLCLNDECWQGPMKPTQEEAVEAWNKLMGKTTHYLSLKESLNINNGMYIP